MPGAWLVRRVTVTWAAVGLLVACTPAPQVQAARTGATPIPAVRADVQPTAELEGWIQAAEGATGTETMAVFGPPLDETTALAELPVLTAAAPREIPEPLGNTVALDWAATGGARPRRTAGTAEARPAVRALAQLVDAGTGKVRGQAVVGPRGDFKMAWLVREATASLVLQVTAVREDNRIAGCLAATLRAQDFRSKGLPPLVVSTGTTAQALALLHLAGGSVSWRPGTGFRGLASPRLVSLIADTDATASSRLGSLSMAPDEVPGCGEDLLGLAIGHAAALTQAIDALAGKLDRTRPARRAFARVLAASRRLRSLQEEQAIPPDALFGFQMTRRACPGDSAPGIRPERDTAANPPAWRAVRVLEEAAAELDRLQDSGLPD
ncbi:MAG: hypothetical protein FJY99_05230 [Candidatus Sericytochromatia bacterium]|nr:hypothetical protein [Candidatus Tanganyikabacteria bacterium]